MKKILSIGLIFLLVFVVSCGDGKQDDKIQSQINESKIENTVDKPHLKLGAMQGPTGIGILNLVENKGSNFEFDLNISTSPDEIVTGMVNGDLDLALVPANLAANLYNKTKGKIVVLSTNNLGVVYVLENGDEIKSFDDLKGKEIVASGKGTTPEMMMTYIASKRNINAEKDMKLEYKADATEVAQMMISGKAKVAMVPEPLVTNILLKNPNVRIALDLNKQWEEVASSKIITSVLIVRKDLLNEIDIDSLLTEYKDSIDKANNDIEGTAALSEKNGLFPKNVAEKAIPNLNLIAITGDDLKKELSLYLEIIKDINAESIGGVKPDEGFYYTGKN